MATFSYETTRENALYCVDHEDVKGIVLYRFNKPDFVFDKELEIVRKVFDAHGLEYVESLAYNKKHGAGYSFTFPTREK